MSGCFSVLCFLSLEVQLQAIRQRVTNTARATTWQQDFIMRSASVTHWVSEVT